MGAAYEAIGGYRLYVDLIQCENAIHVSELASLSVSCAFEDLPSRVFVKLESALDGPAPSSTGVQTSLAVASSRNDMRAAELNGLSSSRVLDSESGSA